MTTDTPGPGHATRRTPLISLFAGAVGLMFLLVGILGFIPGITTDYSQMQFAGHGSDAMLVGLFQVSVLHNIVHLLFGVVGLALVRIPLGAMLFLVVGGAIYLLLWIYGLSIDQTSDANFVPVNTADDWLHFVLGVGMIALGVIGWLARRARSAR